MAGQHIPTEDQRAQVFALAAFGVPQAEIAEFISISRKSLAKHYPDELRRAKHERNAEVAAFLFRSASGRALEEGASYADCIRAAIFWLKTRASWSEKHQHEHSAAGPTEIVIRAADGGD